MDGHEAARACPRGGRKKAMMKMRIAAALALWYAAPAMADPPPAPPANASPPAAAAPPSAPPAAAPPPASPPPGPPPAKPPAEEADTYIMPDTGYASLCFNRSEMAAIMNAAAQYRSNLAKAREEAKHHKQDDYLSTLQPGGNAAIRIVQHPQFYFSSMVYRAPEDWAIWTNNFKFTPQARSDGELTVERVEPQKATFVWKPKLFTIYQERYKTGANDRVTIDPQKQTISFMLYPNETFSAFSLTVEEGWLPASRKEELAIPLQQPGAEPSPDAKLPQAELPAVPAYGEPKK